MFLFHALFVVSVVFWISALIADVAMTSHEEQLLRPVVRVGFGLLIIIVFFSASWLIMSVQQARMLGIGLLVCYVFRNPVSLFNSLLSNTRGFLKKYIKTFYFFLLGSLIFFAPLIIANEYGPFTEGSGDISIYADVSKYLQDRHLTEMGFESKNFSDVRKNIERIFKKNDDEHWKSFRNGLMNPPQAEYASYQVIAKSALSSFYYTPYGVFGFLSHSTNYAVYFGIQAFFYVCIVGAIWCFFRRFGIKISNLSAIIVMASHGLISVFYNMYAMQANSLAISALIIAILPSIRLFSVSGFRTYGSALLILWLIYIHYISVVLPLILLIILANFYKIEKTDHLNKNLSLASKSVAVFFIILWLFVAYAGALKSLYLAKILLSGALVQYAQIYLGNTLSNLSFQWLSFLFGFLSQQHFQPFAIVYPFINVTIGFGILFGFITFIGGMLIAFIQFFRKKIASENKIYFSIYVVCILTIIMHLYLGNTSLYTQAKAAQDILVYFYIAMLLPFGITIHALKNSSVVAKTTIIFLNVTLVLFILALLIIRGTYLTKLAFGFDRGAILGSSYFSEAIKIKKMDPEAFVLFEPRKSADLYLSIQPFFGKKMLPTRDLVLQKASLSLNGWEHYPVLASDLIASKDLSHLWTLMAECHNAKYLPYFSKCKWKSQRLITQTHARLLLFADDYERNYGELPISKNITGWVSFLRNGSAMLFVPKGKEIVVIMKPRNSEHYGIMLKEISRRIEKGEFTPVAWDSDGNNVKLIYKLSATEMNSLKLIAHFSGEYWLNVKLDGHEII